MGLASTRGYRKCAKIVGEVMGNYPSARRRVDLRHARPPRAGLQHALPARRRPGQLRLDRRRPAGGDAVHRGAAQGARRRDDDGPRQGDRRLRPELRRDHRGADGPAGAVPEPAGERIGRHRRRHGDEHPAAQPARGDRRRASGRSSSAPGRDDRRPLAEKQRKLLELVPGPDFPTGGYIVGRARHSAGAI